MKNTTYHPNLQHVQLNGHYRVRKIDLTLHCFLTLSLLHVESYRVRKIDQFLIKFNAPSDYHAFFFFKL